MRFSFLELDGKDGNSGRSFFSDSGVLGGSDGKGGREGAAGMVGASSVFLNNPIMLFALFLFYRFIVII